MAVRIIIDLDVTNPEEVIKAHKGQMMGLLSDVMLSKNSRKKKVNLEVAKEIVAALEKDLPIEMEKEMVAANVRYEIIKDIDMDKGQENSEY